MSAATETAVKIFKAALKITRLLIVITLTALISVILVSAFEARKQGQLQKWHTQKIKSEFNASDITDDTTFDDYLKIEEKVFDELNNNISSKLPASDNDLFNRYHLESFSSPSKFENDYNRSYELIPENTTGCIVLLHGLTDSPYSLRHIGDLFHQMGFHVVSIRLPAHGTIPAALVDIKCQDWIAAVELACKDIRRKVPEDKPFYIAGYSNGGALALNYAIHAITDNSLPPPDRLFLFSPAIGVSKFAVLSKWLQTVSFIPYFEKSRWRSITPEYDPFKYNSFPLNASEQTYKLTIKTKAAIEKLSKKQTLDKLPPITTFQSVVDSTVVIDDLVNRLYARLKGNQNELILFDVNRTAYLHNFLKSSHDHLMQRLSNSDQLGYVLTIVGNDSTARDVTVKSKAPGQKQFSSITSLDTKWPKTLYSLSHIAIVTPTADPLYGLDPPDTSEGYQLQLGRIELRGERNLLRIKANDLQRIRSNPFFDYIADRIKQKVSKDLDMKKDGQKN